MERLERRGGAKGRNRLLLHTHTIFLYGCIEATAGARLANLGPGEQHFPEAINLVNRFLDAQAAFDPDSVPPGVPALMLRLRHFWCWVWPTTRCSN